jgi:hypothetical protein
MVANLDSKAFQTRCSEVEGTARGLSIIAAFPLCVYLLLQLQHCVWPDILHDPLMRIVQAARLAASLQPDGTGLPEVR